MDIARLYESLPSPSLAAAPNRFRRYAHVPGELISDSEPTYFCNRPFDQSTMPLSLLHPVFGHFREDFWNRQPDTRRQQPSLDDLKRSRELSQTMAGFFTEESSRRKAFRSWFLTFFNLDVETSVRSSTTTVESDGHVLISASKFVMLISECKNELFGISSEARFRLFAYYAKLHLASKEAQERRDESCLPAIIIVSEGEERVFCVALPNRMQW